MNDKSWISMYSAFLGLVFSYSGYFSWRLNMYLKVMSVFHFLEFFATSLFNKEKASSESFLIPHSEEHSWMVFASLLEYYLELEMIEKSDRISILGIIVIVLGQFMRTWAMYSAKASFNHQIQKARAADHTLVTTGAFQISRHPSYLGFYLWTMGTQLLLCNYITSILFLIMLNQFFKARIETEEQYLNKFFGKDYEDYASKTRIWLPLI
eukprot:NODE_134_length_16603_cov_0.784052.p9 type:complete len:210 gc:universal NODE_134_length_16603_cov_0.784052:7760-7131(-)